jgi:hypothetical protein
MNIRTTKTQWVTAFTAVAILSGTVGLLTAADAKPKYTTKEVMEALHKGKENIAKNVSAGKPRKISTRWWTITVLSQPISLKKVPLKAGRQNPKLSWLPPRNFKLANLMLSLILKKHQTARPATASTSPTRNLNWNF